MEALRNRGPEGPKLCKPLGPKPANSKDSSAQRKHHGGVSGSSCNGFNTLSTDLTNQLVKRFLSINRIFLKSTVGNSKVYWSFVLGKANHVQRKDKRPHEPRTKRPLSIARSSRALKWCSPFNLSYIYITCLRCPETVTGFDIHPAPQLIAKGHQCPNSLKTNRS